MNQTTQDYINYLQGQSMESDAGMMPVIHREDPNPAVHIAGAFLVPNYEPVQSNWQGVILGGAAILLLTIMLARSVK